MIEHRTVIPVDSYQTSTDATEHLIDVPVTNTHNKQRKKHRTHKRLYEAHTDEHGNITQPKSLSEFARMQFHRMINMINEVISLAIEFDIYVGGFASVVASFMRTEIQDTIEIINWWILTVCLSLYILLDACKLGRPFDQYDVYLRSMLPKFINTYVLGSKVSVTLATQVLIKSGETALLYPPFHVPSRHVEHVSFLVGVTLSFIYAFVSIKESSRPDDKEDAEEEIEDTTIDVKEHVTDTLLEKLKSTLAKTGEEVLEAEVKK